MTNLIVKMASRVLHGAVLLCTIGETSGDTDSANGVKSISILYDGQFDERLRVCGRVRSLLRIGDVFDNDKDMVRCSFVQKGRLIEELIELLPWVSHGTLLVLQ